MSAVIWFAEVLREAAALMRTNAEGVTQGAQWTGGNYWIEDYDPSDPSGQTGLQRLIGGMDGKDADHYSSWHPAVALAVADWLYAAWVAWEREESSLGARSVRAMSGGINEPDHHALAVARAYLGTTP